MTTPCHGRGHGPRLPRLLRAGPNVIPYTNVLDIIHVKEQVNCCKKQKHLLQISAHDFYNDLIFLVSQGRFIGASND